MTEVHTILGGWQQFLQAAHDKLALEELKIEIGAYCFVACADDVREISPLFPCLMSVCSPASRCLGIPGSKELGMM